ASASSAATRASPRRAPPRAMPVSPRGCGPSRRSSRACASISPRAPRPERRCLLALGLLLDHFAEGAFQLCRHRLLEQCEQRLGGERAQRAHRGDQLVPALLRLTRLLERPPHLLEEQPREGARDRVAVA